MDFVENGKNQIFVANEIFKKSAHISSINDYYAKYQLSIQDPDTFWLSVAKQFYWHNGINSDQIFSYNFDVNRGPIGVNFLKGAKTNACYNLIDRIIKLGFGNRIAYYFEGNECNETRNITYNELKRQICKFANVLKSQGIKRGDRVAIYLPVSIELVVSMLACARIGAVHTVVFAGFSSQALSERIIDANCKTLVTANGAIRGNKLIKLKDIADEAIRICEQKNHNLISSIIVKHLPNSINNNISDKNEYIDHFNHKLDHWWDQLMYTASDDCEPVWLDAEDELFILYTSGSTGKPKGVVHTIAGYMLTTALVFKYAFNYIDGDIFFCTADLGWITGHTASVYGALANGATSVLFEGTPIYPDAGRLWQIIDNYKVNTFYTAPTVIRALMKYGNEYVTKHDMANLKLMALVGEPINREAWLWMYDIVGRSRCPIVDTYFQTETGAPMIFPIPGCVYMKPGSATLPFFGIQPAILNDDGKELIGAASGYLVFKSGWPSIARTIDGNHERFENTYFRKFPRYYFTGDGAIRDKEGYYWITGRTDDMLNVSGHLLSTAEVESAILDNKKVAEVAAVSMPHSIKGECICCFIVLKANHNYDKIMETDLKQIVRDKIGPIATPDVLYSVRALPKTRSGKIMRRVLAKIARNDFDLGDLSTIADESVIDELVSINNNI